MGADEGRAELLAAFENLRVADVRDGPDTLGMEPDETVIDSQET